MNVIKNGNRFQYINPQPFYTYKIDENNWFIYFIATLIVNEKITNNRIFVISRRKNQMIKNILLPSYLMMVPCSNTFILEEK